MSARPVPRLVLQHTLALQWLIEGGDPAVDAGRGRRRRRAFDLGPGNSRHRNGRSGRVSCKPGGQAGPEWRPGGAVRELQGDGARSTSAGNQQYVRSGCSPATRHTQLHRRHGLHRSRNRRAVGDRGHRLVRLPGRYCPAAYPRPARLTHRCLPMPPWTDAVGRAETALGHRVRTCGGVSKYEVLGL